MIDLHMHSNYSDGTESPEWLVEEAVRKGLRAIALTDHDTVDGIPAFLAAGAQAGIRTIAGVEISVDVKLPNRGHMHILGLLIDPASPSLKKTLDHLVKERRVRAERIVERLQALDIPVTLEMLLEEAGEGAIGRPHVARVLMSLKVVDSIQKAFDYYLSPGQAAYVPKVKLDEAGAIQLIHDAGGLAILAHPHYMNFDSVAEFRHKILQLQKLGLDGFELYYAGMPERVHEMLKELAETHDFVASGGSDFHGDIKPDIAMGSGLNNLLSVPDELLEELDSRKSRRFSE